MEALKNQDLQKLLFKYPYTEIFLWFETNLGFSNQKSVCSHFLSDRPLQKSDIFLPILANAGGPGGGG